MSTHFMVYGEVTPRNLEELLLVSTLSLGVSKADGTARANGACKSDPCLAGLCRL